MMFPKCMIGRLPFVNVHGQLMPCCWLDTPRYNTNGNIPSSRGMVHNIFNDITFSLHERAYAELISSDDWAMALERLYIEQYHMCGMKCGDFAVIDGKPSWNEFEIDDHIQTGTMQRSTDINLFNKHIIEPSEIRSIQLELTNRCSLKCQYCVRQSDRPKHTQLAMSIVEDVLMSKQWEHIEDVGNYGDTMFYSKYHDFLGVLEHAAVDWYSGHFAATGRGKSWWDVTIDKYDRVIKSGTGVRLTFGIDGLSDTSKLHRIGQDWDEITYGMRKAIDVGCVVFWQFIPMSFNEEQIDKARELAERWGAKFQVHTSSRFHRNDPNKPTNKRLYRERHE